MSLVFIYCYQMEMHEVDYNVEDGENCTGLNVFTNVYSYKTLGT